MQNLKKLKKLKIIKFNEKLFKIIQMMKLKASEKFKEKHPTHRGIPGGNQVDGLPPELRESLVTRIFRRQRKS